MENRTKINKLVGRNSEGLVFCEDFFEHSESFKGVTGYILTPIPQAMYEYWTSQDMLEERFEDVWREMVKNESTTQGLEDFARDVYLSDGDEAVFDFSGYEVWEQAREVGYSEEEYPVLDCIAFGRLFGADLDLDEVYDPELLERIKAVEGF